MDIHNTLITIIAFSAVLTVLITILTFIFNALLNPVKENQVRMEKRMDKIETEVKGISTKLDQLISQNSKP